MPSASPVSGLKPKRKRRAVKTAAASPLPAKTAAASPRRKTASARRSEPSSGGKAGDLRDSAPSGAELRMRDATLAHYARLGRGERAPSDGEIAFNKRFPARWSVAQCAALLKLTVLKGRKETAACGRRFFTWKKLWYGELCCAQL